VSLRLTSEQQALIDLDQGAFLVLAAPGSGKTEVLSRRIIRILGDTPDQKFRILALTFTKKAATAMRERVEASAGQAAARVTATTFHSFCLDLLQHYGDAVGVAPDVNVYDRDEDRFEALSRGITDEGVPLPPGDGALRTARALLADIGEAKRGLLIPDAVPAEAAHAGISVRLAYRAYDRTLALMNAVDYDDLLVKSYELLATVPRISQHYRRFFRYILVDEAQDTSRVQYEILRALCGTEQRNVMLVGDSDQSIYGFAGASHRYLEDFEKDFQAHRYSLSVNFRCSAAILSTALRLIEHNPGRIRGSLPVISGTLSPGHAESVSFSDEASEATGVVTLIQSLLANGLRREWLHPSESHELSPEDICVMGRARYLLEPTIAALESAGVPYSYSIGQSELFESVAGRLFALGLRVLHNQRDVISQENLTAVLTSDLKIPVEIADKPFDERFGYVARAVGGVAASVAEALQTLSQNPAALDRVIANVLTAMRSNSDASSRERALLESDGKSLEACWRSYRHLLSDEGPTLSGLVAEVALIGRAPGQRQGCRVLTIHASKGLEFKVVILIGMNERSFPDFRSIGDPAAEQEERRNAYVAMTRAARYLRLSRPRVRVTPWGATKPQTPSRFIREAAVPEVTL
jgi:DNA helicase II / ATP-dependent DNA helicase PcrA